MNQDTQHDNMNNIDLETILAFHATTKAMRRGTTEQETRTMISKLKSSPGVGRRVITGLVDVHLAAHHAGVRMPEDMHTMLMEFYKDSFRMTDEDFWRRVDEILPRIEQMAAEHGSKQ